ncbi:multidrug ABC transporter ATPase [Microbacterium sp. NPDC076911]|uniref:multidrug ABC transporter ATPase n=1 Tax=Microbacterium sp. NPDC076911 TaxID=3154958 RepID=UPI00343F8E33
MSERTPENDVPIRKVDRILAFMSLGLIVLSILSFLAVMIGSSAGANMSTPLWNAVGIVVIVAPIIAFVLLLTVLISSFVRRARANRGD